MKIKAFGIDQGIANLGIGIVEVSYNKRTKKFSFKLEHYKNLKTYSKYDMGQRVLTIKKYFDEMIDDYSPEIIGCEKFFFNPSQKGGRNKSASIMYTNMSTGIIYLVSGERNIEVREFVPGTVKKAITGNGRATKEEMSDFISKILKLERKDVANEHVADAISIAITAGIKKIEEQLKEEEKLKKIKKKKTAK